MQMLIPLTPTLVLIVIITVAIHSSFRGLTHVIVQCPSNNRSPQCSVPDHPAESENVRLTPFLNVVEPFPVRSSSRRQSIPDPKPHTVPQQINPNKLSFLSIMSCMMFLASPSHNLSSTYAIICCL